MGNKKNPFNAAVNHDSGAGFKHDRFGTGAGSMFQAVVCRIGVGFDLVFGVVFVVRDRDCVGFVGPSPKIDHSTALATKRAIGVLG